MHLAAGPQAYLLAMLRAGAVMRPIGDARSITKDEALELIEQGLCVQASATLEAAMPYFDRGDIPCIPVVTVEEDGSENPVGALYHIDALKAYNRALAATAAEEHS